MEQEPNEPQKEAPPPLTPLEARILGCLMEKSIVTPDVYPLTLNALVHACNQKSNRHPFMQATESDVLAALDELRYVHRLAILSDTAGSRVPKYRHALGNRVVLNERLTALLCELLLRGPQTVGELRTRAARLAPMPDLETLENDLEEMAGGEPPIVVKLPREPGRREARYQHLLCGMPDLTDIARMPEEPARPTPSAREERLAALENAVADLQSELAALRESFDLFRQQFE